MKEISKSNIAVPNPATSSQEAGGKSFADTLKAAVQDVNTQQQIADIKMQEIATGKNHTFPK